MAYQDQGHPDLPAAKSSGVVVPMPDGRGNAYPEYLRTQQVGLGVVRAICDRLDAAIAPRPTEKGDLRPVKLATVFLGDGGRAAVRQYLLAKLLPELYGDPVPPAVRPVKRIVSPKALSLLNQRLAAAFDPPGGTLRLPGLDLSRDDLYELLLLVHEAILGDDRFPDPPAVNPPHPPVVAPPPPPPPPPPPSPEPPPPPVVTPAIVSRPSADDGRKYRQVGLLE